MHHSVSDLTKTHTGNILINILNNFGSIRSLFGIMYRQWTPYITPSLQVLLCQIHKGQVVSMRQAPSLNLNGVTNTWTLQNFWGCISHYLNTYLGEKHWHTSFLTFSADANNTPFGFSVVPSNERTSSPNLSDRKNGNLLSRSQSAENWWLWQYENVKITKKLCCDNQCRTHLWTYKKWIS